MDVILSPLRVKQLAEAWLLEDQLAFDFGALAVSEEHSLAYLYCKQSCVLSGVPFFDAVFKSCDCKVDWKYKDGDKIEVSAGQPVGIAVVSGPCRKILLGERPALNCLSRASGIATLTNRIVELCRLGPDDSPAWSGKIACTRKTTPGFRLVEKYAVMVGGGDSHRYDLSTMIMLKDNHVSACEGNIEEAIKNVRQIAGFSYKIEVEARNEKEAVEAARCGADIIMLDNFLPEAARKTAAQLKEQFPQKIIEISGGICERNIREFCSPYVDVISMGCLTQGYGCIDFSLKFDEIR